MFDYHKVLLDKKKPNWYLRRHFNQYMSYRTQRAESEMGRDFPSHPFFWLCSMGIFMHRKNRHPANLGEIRYRVKTIDQPVTYQNSQIYDVNTQNNCKEPLLMCCFLYALLLVNAISFCQKLALRVDCISISSDARERKE